MHTVVNLKHEFQVEQIIAKKNTKVGVMYYVKWRGYSAKQATWQPLTNLLNSFECIRQYESTKNKGNKGQNKKKNYMETDQSQKQEKRRRKKIFKADKIFPIKAQRYDVELMIKDDIEGRLNGLGDFEEIDLLDKVGIGNIEINNNAFSVEVDSAKSEKEDFRIEINFLEETPQLEQRPQNEFFYKSQQCGNGENHPQQFGFHNNFSQMFLFDQMKNESRRDKQCEMCSQEVKSSQEIKRQIKIQKDQSILQNQINIQQKEIVFVQRGVYKPKMKGPCTQACSSP